MNLHLFRSGELFQTLELTSGVYVLGSGPSADLRITGDTVAAEHVRLEISATGAELAGMESGRPAYVEGSLLEGVHRLVSGSYFQLGDVTVQIWDNPLASESAAVAPPEPARPRYQIGGVVASGAMGVIRGVREISTGREVAMKQIHPERTGDDAVLMTRFAQEAKLTAHLEHPNIVPVHEVSMGGENGGFYTMKMVRGISLERVLSSLRTEPAVSAKQYSLDTLLIIFQKICDGVAFAHSKGVIHRDLKPANVMVGEFGEVLVMDWGLAKPVGQAASGVLAGTADALGGSECLRHAGRDGDGDTVLHGARAGQRRRGRCRYAQRCVRTRFDPLRDDLPASAGGRR
jgi:hypothetical protein